MSVVAFARVLSCCALLSASVVLPAHAAEATPVMAQPKADTESSAPSICIDQMETEPGIDDLEALEVSDTLDGGCATNLAPVSI